MELKNCAKILFLFILAGCAQVTSLNLQKHEFGKIPTKVVWIQLAGFAPEHMALLKFMAPNVSYRTAFEDALCVGSTWEYDLYRLRPAAFYGFMSQMTGKKNIKGTCEDFYLNPIWKYYSQEGYRIGIFEGEVAQNSSLTQALQCENGVNYLSDVVLWSMSRDKNAKNYFHVGEKSNFKVGEIYHDRSCKKGECFTSLSRNVEGTYAQFSKNTKNYLYIVRNFKYESLIKKKKFLAARKELNEINSTIKYFQNLAKNSTDMLVLVTSSAPLDLNFPKSGNQWKNFEKKGRNMKINHTKLMSSVYASGARAENFCGVYAQNQIFSRIVSGAKQQGLEFSIINPFN